jgi:Fe-S-cluster containining protein
MAPDHDMLLADWKAHAARRQASQRRFLRSLKLIHDPGSVDALSQALHTEVFAQIDCTRCANCCKSAAVSLDDADVERIAAQLNLTTTEFIARYLTAYPTEGRYHMQQIPCPFLGGDDRCTIYDVRPAICRSYPNTDGEGFATRSYQHASNAKICPAVYHIVEAMRKRHGS